MTVTTMSYGEAQRIIELYSSILIKAENRNRNQKFRYSELNGYDVLDIKNALNLICAYRVFDTFPIDEEAIEKLKKEVDFAATGTLFFFMQFAPDNIVQQMDKLNSENIEDRITLNKLETSYYESDLWKEYNMSETASSFINFCLSIDKADTNYWEKVYSRIGITWDERDPSDPIYYAIRNKNQFFKEPVQQLKESLIFESENKGELAVEIDKKPSFYTANKILLDELFLISALLLGLIYPVVRIIAFIIFSLTYIIGFYILRKDSIENKFNFTLNFLYTIILIVGIFFNRIGFYVCIASILWAVVAIIKRLALNKQNEK